MLDKVGIKWAEIDLDAIRANIDTVRSRIGKRSIMAVVKADAYGHGAVEVARCAQEAGVRMLGVSNVDEGIQLRESFIDLDILVFGAPLESQACDLINYNLSATVYSEEFAVHLDQECERLKRRVDVHVCVDTGMGRVGPRPDEALPLTKKIMKLKNLNVSGIYTHFSSADEDYVYSKQQLAAFVNLVKQLDKEGLVIPFRHIANSAGVLELEESYYDTVRPGLLLYGISPHGSTVVGAGKLEC